jgi:hypothetical protein
LIFSLLFSGPSRFFKADQLKHTKTSGRSENCYSVHALKTPFHDIESGIKTITYSSSAYSNVGHADPYAQKLASYSKPSVKQFNPKTHDSVPLLLHANSKFTKGAEAVSHLLSKFHF